MSNARSRVASASFALPAFSSTSASCLSSCTFRGHTASARCNVAYVYAAASFGESTTDLSWDGQSIAYECGDLIGGLGAGHEARGDGLADQRLVVLVVGSDPLTG